MDKGATLLHYIGNELRSDGLRILFIETSGLDGFELTLKSYAKNDYSEEVRIRELYGT